MSSSQPQIVAGRGETPRSGRASRVLDPAGGTTPGSGKSALADTPAHMASHDGAIPRGVSSFSGPDHVFDRPVPAGVIVAPDGTRWATTCRCGAHPHRSHPARPIQGPVVPS